MSDTGLTAWMLCATLLVQVMTPALGLFYGGLVSEKAIINTMMLSFATMGVVSVLWAIIGYSLAFGPNALGGFIGDASLGVLPISDAVRVGTKVPELLFMAYQLMFAVITPAVISGAVVMKMRLPYFVAFASLWSIFVYCPLAHWVWAPDGWLYTRGVLDFAGGTVVETASGVSAFVLAFWLGRPVRVRPVKPHNVPYVLLGAALLWFGWFGFNAGSAGSGELASRAFVNTHLAACAGMVTWGLLEMAFPENGALLSGLPTAIGASSGAIVGLVAITPACGFVLPMWAIFIGFLTSVIVYFALRFIKRTGVDDRLDVFAFHGVSGIVGTFLTGLFATTAALSPSDGAFYGSKTGNQLGVQCTAIAVTIAHTAVGTTVIYFVLEGIARVLHSDMRIPLENQLDVDASQHGERAYFAPTIRFAKSPSKAGTGGGNTSELESDAEEGKRVGGVAIATSSGCMPSARPCVPASAAAPPPAVAAGGSGALPATAVVVSEPTTTAPSQ